MTPEQADRLIAEVHQVAVELTWISLAAYMMMASLAVIAIVVALKNK